MITFIQFLETVENKDQKQAFVNQLQLNIDIDKGMYANISDFKLDRIKERLNSWTMYTKLNPADKKQIQDLIDEKGKTIMDLFKAIYSKNQTTEIKS